MTRRYRKHRGMPWIYAGMVLLALAMLWFVVELLPRCCCQTGRAAVVDPVTHDVPEPGTLLLAGAGLVAIGALRK